jgi:hypothetical protein
MNNVLLFSLITLFLVTVTSYSKLFYSFIKVKKETAKLLVTNVMLEEYIKSFEENKIKSDDSVHQENFIKFLSDSRDWAYDYIEKTQQELNHFVDEVEPLLMYFDTYGEAGPFGPNYDALKKISVAFVELKELLPKEER